MPQPRPETGEIWKTNLPDVRFPYCIYLGDGLWNVLSLRDGEYSLHQIPGLAPLERHHTKPASLHWSDQFDTLAAANGIRTTWAEEVDSYKLSGLAMLLAC